MPRSTKRTIRNTPTPLARDLLRFANTADRLSRRAKTLAAKVRDVEIDAGALRAMLAASGEHIEHLRALAEDEEPQYCGECGMSHTPPECEGKEHDQRDPAQA